MTAEYIGTGTANGSSFFVLGSRLRSSFFVLGSSSSFAVHRSGSRSVSEMPAVWLARSERITKNLNGERRTSEERRTENGRRALDCVRHAIHPCLGPGNHQLARHPVRSRRRPRLCGAERVHSVLPEARVGRARPARDLGHADRGGGRGARPRAGAAAGHRGDRHHQPARDHDRLGPGDRAARPSGDRVAGSPDRGALRPAQGGRQRGARARPYRARDRCLFFREQDRLDSGQRSGGARASQCRSARVRDGRFLARVEADERRHAHHRRQQRVADHAVQHPHAGLGRRSARAAPCARRACCPTCAPRASSTGASRPA